MKKAEMMTGAVLLVLAGLVMRSALMMPPSATFAPGAGFLPFWLALLLAVLATILFATAWKRPITDQEKEPVFPARKALLTIAAVLVGVAIYIALIETLGYLVDTFLLIVFMMKAVQREKWPLTLAIAIVTTGVLYGIFQVLLKITLPANMFGF